MLIGCGVVLAMSIVALAVIIACVPHSDKQTLKYYGE